MTDAKQTTLFGGAEPEDQDQTEGCEPEGGCEEEPKVPAKGKDKDPKTTSAKVAKATAVAKPVEAAKPVVTKAAKHTYPFNVRYAAEFLELMGFVDGQEYGDAEIKDLLIQNGYTEFADVEPAFHLSTATNTLVITIKGSKKGGCHGQ